MRGRTHWVQYEEEGLPVVYMHPKEKPTRLVGMFIRVGRNVRAKLAHAYVDAWSSANSRSGLDTTTVTDTRNVARPASERPS